MTKPPVTSFSSLTKRQVYSLLLKLLTLFGVVIFMAVLINSLWGLKEVGEGSKKVTHATSVLTVTLDDLRQGAMKRILFQGQDIAILYRIDNGMISTNMVEKETQALNETWRSIKKAYFVFINASGPTRCPLHLSADAQVLKDICSGITYDTTGRNKRGGVERLIIPPHYYNKTGQLVLGAWRAAL